MRTLEAEKEELAASAGDATKPLLKQVGPVTMRGRGGQVKRGVNGCISGSGSNLA